MIPCCHGELGRQSRLGGKRMCLGWPGQCGSVASSRGIWGGGWRRGEKLDLKSAREGGWLGSLLAAGVGVEDTGSFFTSSCL